ELQQNLNDGVSVAASLGAGNPMGAAMTAVNRLLGNNGPSPEMIQEASKILLAQGLTDDQIRQVLSRSLMSQRASLLGQSMPGAVRGAVVPAYQPLIGGDQ